MSMPLGLYLSVPFCRTKCSYCNFASDVFSRAVFERYVSHVRADIERAAEAAEQMGGRFERAVDSVYLGGGTPTVLDVNQLERLFVTISQKFEVQPGAEITVECAPGTLSEPMIERLIHSGVNRVSLGVQSFVDEEARAVGRLHTRTVVLDDMARLRAAGISNINIDLIAGLPHQTAESWEVSLAETVACGAPHASVYMLEVDEDSRLGRELIAGGTRYHAHFVPDEDLTADLYTMACDRLNAAGVQQYEISNFAHEGRESRHNLKYWTRQPYLGFGMDAHSMLFATGVEALDLGGAGVGLKAHSSTARSQTVAEPPTSVLAHSAGATVDRHSFSRADSAVKATGFTPCGETLAAVRFATPDSLEAYLSGVPLKRTVVARQAALEESFFLGLRLTRGVDLRQIGQEFGEESVTAFADTIAELVQAGLLSQDHATIHLTPRGRLLSNEVFQRFISVGETV
jgi:oxygen-independent coproporphyrinogen-3 oxidase